MNILVPADGSWASYQAELYAIGLCKKWGGKVIAIHIYHPDYHRKSWRQIFRRDLFWKLQSKVDTKQMVERVKEMGSEAGIQVETVMKGSIGSPAKEIIKYIKERGDIDLIVLGPRKRHPLLKVIFGSTTNGLLRQFGEELKIPLVQVPERV
jgi:nucleotide-binding universal stress UspA family protein